MPNAGAASLQLFEAAPTVEALSGFHRKASARDGGNDLLEELQPFGADVRAKDGIAGDVAARPGEARHQPGAAPDRRSRS